MPGDAGDVPGGAGFAQGVVEVVGPDLERSLAFYLSLGFELLRRSGPFAVVHWRGQRLFLAENPDAPSAPRWTSLRIMVDDVDAVWQHAWSLGLEPVHAIGDRFYGLRDFTVAAPDGFELRFAQARQA
jgi:catechol 2,3-dioxygenase-like lactoylglutathione lyase family enzyme